MGDLLSLTSILYGKSELRDFIYDTMPARESFETNNGIAPFSAKLVPKISSGCDPSKVGMLSDYLIRLYLNWYYQIPMDHHVAQAGIAKADTYGKAFRKAGQTNASIFMQTMQKQFAQWKSVINDFVTNGTTNKEIGPALAFMIRWEAVAHGSKVPTQPEDVFTQIDNDIFNESVAIRDLFRETFIDGCVIDKNSEVIINPIFAPGAEGDFLADGVLYDFKSAKTCGYRRKSIAQLWGYYLYDRVAGENRIKRLALYMSRFGVIESCPVEASEKLVSEFKQQEEYYRILHP